MKVQVRPGTLVTLLSKHIKTVCNRLVELKPQEGAKMLKTETKQSDDEVFMRVG
jgi:hypothetical protein